MFREHKLDEGLIAGDADGLGAPILDRMAESGWRLERYHRGRPAENSELYANDNAQLWFEARVQAEKR